MRIIPSVPRLCQCPAESGQKGRARADLVDKLRGQAHRCTDCGLNSTVSGDARDNAMERRAEGGVRVLRGECALQLQRSATSLRPALRLVCGRACAPHELLVLAELDARELWGPGVGGNGRRVKKCDQHNSARWARTALSADPAKAGAGRHARVGVALAVDAAHHGKRLRPALLLCASSDRFQFSRALQARARRGGVPVAAGCPGSVQQRHVAGTANRQEGGCGREAALCHQRCCRAAGRVDCCRPWT